MRAGAVGCRHFAGSGAGHRRRFTGLILPFGGLIA